MRSGLLLMALLLTVLTAFNFSQNVKKPDKYLSLQVGIGGVDLGYDNNPLNLGLSYEVEVKKGIHIGCCVYYEWWTEEYGGYSQFQEARYRYSKVTPTVFFHYYPKVFPFDIFGGLCGGYNFQFSACQNVRISGLDEYDRGIHEFHLETYNSIYLAAVVGIRLKLWGNHKGLIKLEVPLSAAGIFHSTIILGMSIHIG